MDFMKFALNFFIIFFLLWQPAADDAEDFYSYVLAIEWPVAFCQARLREGTPCRPDLKFDFSIHGIWPQRKKDTGEGKEGSFVYCEEDGTKFPPNLATDIPTINDVWPSLLNPNAITLWKHVWKKHGTCSPFYKKEAESDILGFFNFGVRFHKAIHAGEFLEKLKAAKVLPKPYKLQDYHTFLNEIKNIAGFKPKLQCVYLTDKKGASFRVLSQMLFCANKEKVLEDCNTYFSNCKLGFYWPPGLYKVEYEVLHYPGKYTPSAVNIWMIVFVLAIAVSGGYAFYRYRVQRYMDSEIRSIMAQYMPLDNRPPQGSNQVQVHHDKVGGNVTHDNDDM